MAKKSDKSLVKIRLKALGELSPVTGGVMLRQGDVIEVEPEVAQAALASGRWEEPAPVAPATEEPNQA
ncbi:MAG: hypothetical protein AB1824_01310 [Acidobacteriota bacterium]